MSRLLERDTIPFERVRENKRQTVDLRLFLAGLNLSGGGDLWLDLHMDNGRTAKPHEAWSTANSSSCWLLACWSAKGGTRSHFPQR